MGNTETIYRGFNLTVVYSYESAEERTLEYPGCEERLDIDEVILRNVDITELLSDEILDEISAQVLAESKEF